MFEKNLVSVLMSVYNCENYIKSSVKSILEQSYRDFELIIFDDASEDKTVELIEEFNDSRVILIKNKSNQGLTKNLNQGLELASGKYIVRMDGDDIACPLRLEKQLQFMEEHPEVVLSGCWMKNFGEKSYICKSLLDTDVLKIDLLFNTGVFHPTFIVRNEVIREQRLRYDERLIYAQDYDFLTRISRYGVIANIEDVLLKYRVHSGQISVDKYNEQLFYANITRKRLLEELQIFISEEKFVWWSKFCMLDFHILQAEEMSSLEEITQKIIERNTVLKIYNTDKLRERLNKRLQYYFQKSNNPSALSSTDKVEQNKYFELFQLMCQWTLKKKDGKNIGRYLLERGFSNIAIYGMGDLGNILTQELKESDINVKYGIDSDINVPYLIKNLKIYHVDELLEPVDAIVVTPITHFSVIRNVLQKKVQCEILPLDEIIYGL